MGLASKLAASQGAAPASQSFGQPPSALQPGQQARAGGPPQGQYGQPPYPQQQQGQYSNVPPVPSQGQYGGQQGQYTGAPGGGYPPPQQQGQYGQPPSNQYGQPPRAQYGQPPQGQAQYGQPPQGQYGQQQGQYGQPTPGPYGQQQQGQYGQPPRNSAQGPYGAPPLQGAPQNNQAANYLSILQAAVRENGLEPFYPPQRLQQLAATIGPQVQQISQAWQIPMELAVDLVRLALYDIVLFCDDSGSMSFEENGERIEDLKLILHRAAFAASLFDTNGIDVRFMNGSQLGSNIRNEQQVQQLLQQTKFHGLTPLGTALQSKVIGPMVEGPARSGSLQKPVLIVTVTDGHPAGENSSTIFKVIRDAKSQLRQTRYGPGAVAFQFAQVGSDLKAREFLAKLDSDREVGSMVDCTSNYEVEQDEMARLGVDLSPSAWIVKLLMGAIDKSYDSQDERRR